MLVITLCAALVAAGLVLVIRDAGAPAAPRGPRSPQRPLHLRVARFAAVMAAAGLGAGLLAAGAGGRLAMRALALTSDMDGTFTEGGAVIGDITLDGTVELLFFAGTAAGVVSAVAYALLFPLLPRGRAGGLALGTFLLVLAGSRLEPLRDDNIDFALLGPDWLSVLLFVAVGLFHGLVVVALANRLSPEFPLRAPQRAIAAGRIAAALVVLVALPGFVGSLSTILTDGA